MEHANFVYTRAPLLSGRNLDDCQDANDDTCRGGVAAVAAFSRFYSNGYPTLTLPTLNHADAFVQMHPLGWGVNRLVLRNLMNWEIFVARPWLLTAEEAQNRSLANLQSQDWPLVLSNTAPPPTNSWFLYTKAIHFDSNTGLAVITIWDNPDSVDYYYPQIESALSLLDYIAKVNMESGCVRNTSFYDYFVHNSTIPGTDFKERICWVPMIVYRQQSSVTSDLLWESFLASVTMHDNPPALVIDVEGRGSSVSKLSKVSGSLGTNIWVVSFQSNPRTFYHCRLLFDNSHTVITDVLFSTEDLSEPLPEKLKDDRYVADIAALRQYADETVRNNPVIGFSTFVPVIKDRGFVFCEAGECGVGNMFTDALRWYAQSDFSFSNSGAYHGLGWPAGEVRVANLWEAFPFSNAVCTGTMSGISMFRMFNFSVSSATFSSIDTVAGGNLLQVSGVRVTYNTQLDTRLGRLVNLEIWNRTLQQYIPVERLKMYEFASDNYNCQFNQPFNTLSGSALTIPGEVAGRIGSDTIQNIAANYLTQLDAVYDAEIQGRLINNTSVLTPLNFIQTERGCQTNTYWVAAQQTCFECPSTLGVIFAEESLGFEGASGSRSSTSSDVILQNGEDFSVAVILRSVPPFLTYTGTITSLAEFQPVTIEPSESLTLTFSASAWELEAGTAAGEVLMGVLPDREIFPGCVGPDVNLNVEISVLPANELNQLGAIRNIGWALAALSMITPLLIGICCLYLRTHPAFRTMQPLFLKMICVGVFIMASAIIPLSIDDGLVSPEGCDIACMLVPWLISMGFTVTFSALFSKLWRINKLFRISHAMRRVMITEKDVIGPFVVLFTLNFILLLAFTLHDPLQWERIAVEGQPWNTYGLCTIGGSMPGTVYSALIGVVNIFAFCLACWQAFMARNLGDNFSEAKRIAAAIFSWFQLTVVVAPILFLIDENNQQTRYFVLIGLLSAYSMSLIFCIFFPIFLQWKEGENLERAQSAQITRVTGRDELTRVTGIDISTPRLNHLSDDNNEVPRTAPPIVEGDEKESFFEEGDEQESQTVRLQNNGHKISFQQ